MTGEEIEAVDFGVEGNALHADSKRRAAAVQVLRDRIVHASDPPTVQSTLMLLAEIDMILDEGLSEVELTESVHPEAGMRLAAEAGKRELSRVSFNLALDRPLYDAISAFENHQTQDPILKRFIAHALRDFRRAGVDKDDETRAQIRQIKESLVRSSQEFNRNIREDTRYIELTSPAQLAGLPSDFALSHKPDEQGIIRISTDYPDFVPFMSYAKDPDLRRELYLKYLNRAYPKNESVLADIFSKRHRLAELVGHPSYASFAVADKMIGSADAIRDFVDRIADIAEEQSQADVTTLLERKRKDRPDAVDIEDFEKSYYAELVRMENLNFDSQEVRPYFEYSRVKTGILEVAGVLFGLNFQAVQETTWHPSVEVFDVIDGGETIGRMYLDMHPRPNKYKHAAMFPLLSGVQGQRLPKAALVCNFPAPTQDHPALLEHSEVVTFFHEFGHLLHHLLGGHQPFSRFSGVATEWDFVEVPSQLLEEWAYSYDALKRFAVHFESGAAIPEEMVQRLNQARTFGRGSRVRQQMFYAALAYRYHSAAPSGAPLIEVLREMQEQYSPYRHMEGTHMHAGFGHLEGYSALYYTYMWSLVIVRDLFSQFETHGLFNKEVAARYRNCVLAPGGSKDAAQLVRDFLGRDYNLQAFRDWVNES